MVGVRFSLNLDGTDDGPVLEFDDGTSVRTVEEMATHPQGWVRQRAAWSESCPAQLLEVLAQDPDPGVRAATCTNPNTPSAVLQQLALDPEVLVRRAVASGASRAGSVNDAAGENASVDEKKAAAARAQGEVLAHLARDDAHQVRAAACEYLGDPLLLTECARDTKAAVRQAVAANSLTPPGVLADLTVDRSKHVRAAVAANPATPAISLETLSEDKQAEVRQAAWLNHHAPTSVRVQALRTGATRRQILDHLTDEDLQEAITHAQMNIHGRIAAIVALVRRDPATDLAGYYRHEDPRIHKAAARAIAQVLESTPTDILEEELVDADIDQDLRVGVLSELLSRPGAPEITVFTNHEHAGVREAAQQVLYNALN